jgi:hypothetical protein
MICAGMGLNDQSSHDGLSWHRALGKFVVNVHI